LLFVPAATSSLNPAVLGPDRGAFAGAVQIPAAETEQPCGRGLSCACV